jgi:hypothetical protein
MSAEDTTTVMYAPLVEYTQNKEFAGLMETLFGAVEKLQERAVINEGEYLDLANLTKKLYDAKTQIQQSVVYVEIVRRARKEPPAPPKAVDKLTDKNYRTCEFCNGRYHCKFLREHQRTTKSCIKQQQARRNIKTEKYAVKDDRHTWRQAFAVQLVARYKSGVINGNRMETVIKIRNGEEHYEDGRNYIHNDRIMGVITPPPYVKIDEETGEEKTIYPSKENHSRANIRVWDECRPEVAPVFEPYHQWEEADCKCCGYVGIVDVLDENGEKEGEDYCNMKIMTCGVCVNPNKKIGGGLVVVKTQEEVSKEIREVNSKKTNKELFEICMSRGIKVSKSYKKEDFISALVVDAFAKKTAEVDEVYETVAENDVCFTYEKAPKKKKNKKAPLLIVEDDE